MNKQAPIHYIKQRVLCYTTEKKERVKQTIKYFLPKEHEIEETELEGNFGNKYWLLESKIDKSKEIRDLIKKIKKGLEKKRYLELKKEIPKRINEECSFYLRFNKQKAYQKELELTTKGDAVLLRFKVKAYPAKKQNAIEVIKDYI